MNNCTVYPCLSCVNALYWNNFVMIIWSIIWLDGITYSMDISLIGSETWWWTAKPGVLQSMGSQRAGHDWATELNWTELNMVYYLTIYNVINIKNLHFIYYMFIPISIDLGNLKCIYTWRSIILQFIFLYIKTVKSR